MRILTALLLLAAAVPAVAQEQEKRHANHTRERVWRRLRMLEGDARRVDGTTTIARPSMAGKIQCSSPFPRRPTQVGRDPEEPARELVRLSTATQVPEGPNERVLRDILGPDPIAALFAEELGAVIEVRTRDLPRVQATFAAAGLADQLAPTRGTCPGAACRHPD